MLLQIPYFTISNTNFIVLIMQNYLLSVNQFKKYLIYDKTKNSWHLKMNS